MRNITKIKRKKGIWLVDDNFETILVYLGKKEQYPLPIINYMIYKNELSEFLLKLLTSSKSAYEISEEICRWFAEKADENEKNCE